MDKRVARGQASKAKLKEAFLELVQTEEPGDITVVELCEKTGLNRSTFYVHYDYMGQLIREVLMESIGRVIEGYGTQWELPLEDGGVDRAAIAVYLRRLLSDPTVSRFCTCSESASYRDFIIRAHIELTLGPSLDPVRYSAAYIHNAGVLSFLFEWLKNGPSVPEETVIEIIHEFSKVMYRPMK